MQNDRKNDWKGKRVLVVGLGKSGHAAALFLRQLGAEVTVTDTRPAEEFAQQLSALLEAGIAVAVGGHPSLSAPPQDLLVISPGVPMNAPLVVEAKALGLPVIGELELASRFLPGKILAITGSNGKTTTTALLGEILKAASLPTQVGGNIGTPVIDLIAASTEAGWSVLEVSSFQLETTDTFRPAIAVILNITPDHLDRHGSLENYALAKERIFAAQTSSDALVLNRDNERAARAAERSPARVFWFSRTASVPRGAWVEGDSVLYRSEADAAIQSILPLSAIPLKGNHNVENILAAVVAARLAGVPPDAIRRAIESFHAVEHRLEYVATIDGIAYYNDSKATNVDATAKALAAFPSGIHLILGGKDKNSDYRELAPLLRERVAAVYTIGAAAEKIASHLDGMVALNPCQTLENAVRAATCAARAGEVVLLAPACASFDQFESYEHRGRVFKQLVGQLQISGQARIEKSKEQPTWPSA